MSELRDLVEKNVAEARAGLQGCARDERVTKAWNPGGAASAPNTSPSTPIPGRPGHGPAGKPGQWVGQAPPVPSAEFGKPGVWVLATTPSGSAPGGAPGAWSFQESNPAHHNIHDSAGGDKLAPGDLVHFNGVGDSSFTVTVTQVRQGQAIGTFNGMTVSFPESDISASPGGSDGAPLTTPSQLQGGRGTGLNSSKTQKSLNAGELALLNKASNRYGDGTQYVEQPEGSETLHKALDRIAFGAPGLTAAIRQVQAKLAG